MLSKDTIDFLTEYRDLCEKYSRMIAACGCCNSPVVVLKREDVDDRLNPGGPLDAHLKHLFSNVCIDDEEE